MAELFKPSALLKHYSQQKFMEAGCD